MDASFYSTFATSMSAQEAQLNTLQQQVSTGLAVQTPDQNPAAYETAAFANDQVSELAADNLNQAAVKVQLGAVSDAYSSTSLLLDNVQGTIEQALNGTSSTQNLNSLGQQVTSASQQLFATVNTTADNGLYLFGGSRGGLAPFQQNAAGNIVYFGDGASSQAEIGQNQSVGSIANGDVFVSSLAGDGTAQITATAANTGTGVILSKGMVNAAQASAFQQGNTSVTLSFASNGAGQTTYSYVDPASGSTVNGTLNNNNSNTGGTELQIAGMEYEITGNPAAGDSFTLAPARPQSMFSLLQTVSSAMSSAADTPAQVAQTSQVLNQSLATLSQYQQGVTTAQAQNGVMLQAISNASASNSNQTTQAQTVINSATAANMPVAIASLEQTTTSLQAAMKTFASVQGLSLFSYL